MSHSNQPRSPRGTWRYIGKTRRIYIRVTPIEAARINVKFLRQYLEQISNT